MGDEEKLLEKLSRNFTVLTRVSHRFDDCVLPKEFVYDTNKYKKKTRIQTFIMFIFVSIISLFFGMAVPALGLMMFLGSIYAGSILIVLDLVNFEGRNGEVIEVSKEGILIKKKVQL